MHLPGKKPMPCIPNGSLVVTVEEEKKTKVVSSGSLEAGCLSSDMVVMCVEIDSWH